MFARNKRIPIKTAFKLLIFKIKGTIYDPVNKYNYVKDTKVGVSIGKLMPKMHINRDISI